MKATQSKAKQSKAKLSKLERQVHGQLEAT
jgi:hypothetical protein